MTIFLDDRVRRFLAAQRVGHLATVSARGEPHVVPVCYAVGETAVYTPIDEKPKQAGKTLQRIQNILATGRAAFIVDRYDEDWSRLGWVLLRCRAELLPPATPEHALALTLLRQRYPQYVTMALERHGVLALRVQGVTTWGTLT